MISEGFNRPRNFEELDKVFKEASRIIRSGGTFIFTTMCDHEGGPKGDEIVMKDTRWGRKASYHGKEYVRRLLKDNGFDILGSILFVGGIDPESDENHHNWAYLVRNRDML